MTPIRIATNTAGNDIKVGSVPVAIVITPWRSSRSGPLVFTIRIRAGRPRRGGHRARRRNVMLRLLTARVVAAAAAVSLCMLAMCVPRTRLRRSGGMSVLVDHPAETVVSAYREAFDPVGFERVGQLRGVLPRRERGGCGAGGSAARTGEARAGGGSCSRSARGPAVLSRSPLRSVVPEL